MTFTANIYLMCQNNSLNSKRQCAEEQKDFKQFMMNN